MDIAVVVSYPNIQLTTVLGQLNEPADDEESNDTPTSIAKHWSN